MEKIIVELIRDAGRGDQAAFSELKDRYRPMIDGCVRRFSSDDMTDQDKEDLAQEALINFFNSICSYDSEQSSVEFGLYAKICIENGLVSFVRLHKKRNRIRYLSLNDDNGTISSLQSEDVLQSLIDREQTAILVRKIKKQLSPYENKVWWMYVAGMSVGEIAKKLSAESKSVSNAIYRIRKKLKESLGGSQN